MAGPEKEPRDGGGSQGPATDSQNVPVVDPTQNVLDLVEAAIRRQDDLREKDALHVREILELREQVRKAAEGNLQDVARLRDRHAKELREMEADRINAIRAVDVEAVQRTAEVQATQASTLATQVAASAEAMRTQVQAAAEAARVALVAALEPIMKDIADLRRAQYEAQGQKTQVVERQAAGESAGMWVGVAVGAAALVISAAAIIVAVLLSGGS